jgi:hypothetical protein
MLTKAEKAAAIEYLESIPDYKWLSHAGTPNDELHGYACGLQHLSRQFKFEKCLGGKLTVAYYVNINDGLNEKYKQPTPKARFLAALNDEPTKEENEL